MSEHSAEKDVTGLMLRSDGLLSKWGFGDGDLPDTVWDLIDAHGIDYAALDWHRVLTQLVRERLLPALDQRVEVYEIDTIHNPVRAATIDGEPVSDDVIYGRVPEPTLTPEYVVVPWEAALVAIRASVLPPEAGTP